MILRLSVFWLIFMAGYGVFFPFFGLYLRETLGLSGTQVGLVLGVLPLVGLIGQPFWGQVADRTGARRRVLATVVAGMGLMSLVVGLLDGWTELLAGVAVLAVFSTSVLPMATAVSMAGTGSPAAFGLVRVWGTIGFLASVVFFPRLVGALGRRSEAEGWPWHGLGLMFPAIAALGVAASLLALRLPSVPSLEARAERGQALQLFRHPPIVRLVAVTFAAHACMQGPINLFPLYVSARGGHAEMLGRMWVFMLLLEIPLVALSGRTLTRFGARGLILVGLVSEGVRWTTTALQPSLALVGAVQLLHGVGVAGVLVGGPLYLEQSVPEELRSSGQALVSTAGFGAGAIVSVVLGGMLFDRFGPGAPYAVAAAGAFALAALLFRVLPEPRRPEARD